MPRFSIQLNQHNSLESNEGTLQYERAWLAFEEIFGSELGCPTREVWASLLHVPREFNAFVRSKVLHDTKRAFIDLLASRDTRRKHLECFLKLMNL